MINVNQKVASVNRSATLQITSLTKRLIREGKDVVNFAAGEPDFDTPPFIKQAAVKALEDGFTKYTPSLGIPELREAIAEKLAKENEINVQKENIIVTSGAKYAIFCALFSLLDPGDEVIIPVPYWVSYPEMIKLVSAKPVFLDTVSSGGFKLTASDLKKTLTARTKLLVLNYPGNPAGTTYSLSELESIWEVAREKNIIVLSDEIYETLVYDGKKHVSFASFPGALDRTVTINGFSKTFSMTGWRVGYMAAPLWIIEAASKVIDHTTSCACSVSQRAALAGIKDDEWKLNARDEFQKRRDAFWEGISQCPGIKAVKTQGAFYMLCDIRSTGLSSVDFATRLLNERFVSCIPADSFGAPGFIRFSFSTGLKQISKGIERIKSFLNT